MSEQQSDGMTRRDVLIGAASGLALAAIEPRQAEAKASPAARASGQVSGIVFEDKDGSGVSSAANLGLAGVLDPTATTSPSPAPTAATRCRCRRRRPSSHQACRLHASGRTAHQPAALLSPSLSQGLAGRAQPTLRGPAPTQPLPASVDFPLRRQDEPKAFNVVLVTDPQPETGAEVDFVREDLIQALAGVDAKFGLTAGDIMFDDLSPIRARTPSWARSGSRGGMSAATMISTSKRPIAN